MCSTCCNLIIYLGKVPILLDTFGQEFQGLCRHPSCHSSLARLHHHLQGHGQKYIFEKFTKMGPAIAEVQYDMLRSYIRQSEDSAGFCDIIGAKQLAGFVPKILPAIFFFLWWYVAIHWRSHDITFFFWADRTHTSKIQNVVHTFLLCDHNHMIWLSRWRIYAH